MQAVRFGQNYAYVIQGGDPESRYLKRLELTRLELKAGGMPKGRVVLELYPDRTTIQVLTEESDEPLFKEEAIVALADQQEHVINLGNVIDLDA